MNNLSDMNVVIDEYHRLNHNLNQYGWKREKAYKKKYFSHWLKNL
ncbi:hypothetical protein QTG56_15295 [Rossellomorea sp. AcN35-11]|nr:hypothetical protein [Cytobacillus spongiae]WJV28451.1 hypothetical protein QTG56_15295 [Rossellomorea sp. AcN35-11]